MRNCRYIVMILSLSVMTFFVARGQEKSVVAKMDEIALERRLTILEDFMAEVRRNSETNRSFMIGIAVGVGGLIIERILFSKKSRESD